MSTFKTSLKIVAAHRIYVLVYLVVLGLVLRPRQEEVRIFQAVLKRKRGGGQPEATPPADGGAAPTV